MVKLILTTGDPAGIGQEIILKTIANNDFSDNTKIIIAGDQTLYKKISEKLNINFKWNFYDLNSLEPGLKSTEEIIFVQGNEGSFSDDVLGNPSPETAKAALSYLLLSAQLLKNGEVDGVVTAPISKEQLWKIGFRFPGHTEFYAKELGAEKFVMMLGGEKLKVTLVTIHIPLKEIWNHFNEEKIEDTIVITDMELRRSFGMKNPRIAVAGLNPHAGEGGKMGREEIEIISPVIERLKPKGLNVYGPFPPDTLYYRAYKGDFDVVVSMYHDQGLIPLKLAHFDDAVNVTLGLPKVRTSVDHGTAFDIATNFSANFKSMEQAVKTALFMVKNRNGE